MQRQWILTLKKDRLTLEVLALALTASILSLLPGVVAIEFADLVGVYRSRKLKRRCPRLTRRAPMSEPVGDRDHRLA